MSWADTKEARWEKIAREDPMTRWKRADGVQRGSIKVGESVSSGRDVHLSLSDLATHLHGVGATGVGKSFFLEIILKNLILLGHGCALITPHNEIFMRMMQFCAHLNLVHPELGLPQRVIPFDLSDTRRIIGFNPVARNARVLSYQVVSLIEAMRKNWGADSFEATPRLARWLFNMAWALVDANLTLVQGQRLVDNKPHPLRSAIVRRIKNPDIRAEWEFLMSPKSRWPSRDDPLESSFNRIRAFNSNEILRLILGQYTNTLDFPAILRDRKILLVNSDAPTVLGNDDRHLVTTCVVNELLTWAFARPLGEREPFFLVIDEFQHSATKDLCAIADEGRKFRIHLVLMHQLLHQLKEHDPEVYYSTMANARTKVVFGGLMDEDLDIMARELFVGELDTDEVKHEIWQTKYAPVESSRIVVTESESESGSESHTEVSHRSLAESTSFIADSGFLRPEPQSVSLASGSSEGSTDGRNSGWSRSRSESRVPFYEFHEYKELSSVTFRSLEEQLYKKKAQLKRQPRQHAALLIPGREVELIKVPNLRDVPVSARQVDEFKHACWDTAGCFARPDDAEREIAALEARLLETPPIEVRTEEGIDDSDVD
jgi:hypothetical protein